VRTSRVLALFFSWWLQDILARAYMASTLNPPPKKRKVRYIADQPPNRTCPTRHIQGNGVAEVDTLVLGGLLVYDHSMVSPGCSQRPSTIFACRADLPAAGLAGRCPAGIQHLCPLAAGDRHYQPHVGFFNASTLSAMALMRSTRCISFR